MTSAGPTFFDQNRFSRRRFMQFSAVGAGAVAISPYLSKLKAFAAPPVADNQGHPRHHRPGRWQRRPEHGDPVRRRAVQQDSFVAQGHELAPHRQRARAAPVDAEAEERVSTTATSPSSAASGTTPPDLSHFTSGDIWMRGWGGKTPVTTTGWAGRFLDTLPNADHESLYGVSLHGSVNEHLWSAVAHPSSLPLNINGAFGIDRSNASDARMFDSIASFGSGASGLGPARRPLRHHRRWI